MGLSAKIIILGVVLSYPSTSSSLLFNPAPILSKAQTQQLLLPHSALQSDSFAVLSNMDLLCSAYSGDSDDEPETKPEPTPEHEISMLPLPKRQKLGYSNHPVLPPTYQCSHLLTESPVPGRYISKRERALLDSLPAAPGQDPNPSVVIPPALGSISDSDLPRNILSLLRQPKGHQQQSQIPKRISVALRSHTKAVNAIHWSPTHAHLLASAGLDNTICIWNVWSRSQKKARVFNFHSAGVKDVKWSTRGLFVLSCGYDCSSRLIDIEKGIETQNFKEDQVVGVVKFHPHNSNLFLSGGMKGQLRLWDIRTGKPVHEYTRGLGPILDIEFTLDGKQFISSSDVSSQNISENSIIIWDVSRQVPLSNQRRWDGTWLLIFCELLDA